MVDGSTYGAASQYDGGFQGQQIAAHTTIEATTAISKRPEMTRPNDPPYIQFGADADAYSNIRAFGKPILWGLLPGDLPSTSSPTFADEDEEDENRQENERMKEIIKEETSKSEERYLKFREDYVSKMINRFGSSLDSIRIKEGETIMKESRLKVLIDSIAFASDTFTSRNGNGIWKVDNDDENNSMGEREIVLEGLEKLDDGHREGDDEQMES